MIGEDLFYAAYGDVKVKFSHYYKYSFEFTGKLIDGKIVCYLGECADDIYNLDVKANKSISIGELMPDSAYIYDKAGKLLERYQK